MTGAPSMASPRGDAAPRGSRSRWLRWLLWVLAAGLAAAALLRLVEVATDQLAAPFDLAWESPTLRTIELLQAGRDPYDPAVYAAPPFWLSPYMPLYTRLVAALPSDPGNPFATGRLVSLCSLVLAASSLLIVGRRALPLALLAVATFFLLRPAVTGAAYLKCDGLALLFSVATVLAAERGARGSRGWLVLGALTGAAALLTKQNFVAAAAAGGLWLLLVDRRRALTFLGLLAVFVGAPLAWLWSDGFRFSVFESLQNPMAFSEVTGWWSILLAQPVFVLLVAASLGAGLVALSSAHRGVWVRTPLPLYAVTATLVLFATLGKLGSGPNYFLEPALACLLALVEAGRHGWSVAAGLAAPRLLPTATIAAVLLLVAAGVELRWEPGSDCPARLVTPEGRANREVQLAGVADAVRSLGVAEPLILNQFATTLTFPLPGTICASDPFQYFLLYESGRLSTDPVVAALTAREFDGVFAAAGLLETSAPSSPIGALHRALQQNYRVGLRLGPMDYLVPKVAREPRR